MRKILLLAVLLSTTLTTAQDYTKGKQLFNTHCASCHKMDKKLVGPALNDIVARQGEEWTKAWIYNNNQLRESGDEYAIQVYEEYNKMAMPAYNFLKDEELDDIVTYLAQYQTKKDEAAAAVQSAPTTTAGPTTVVQSEPSTWIYLLLVVTIIFVALGLFALHKGLQTIVSVTAKTQKTNLWLMKQQGTDPESVEKDFEETIETEVKKRVDGKIKEFKKSVNKRLKDI